MPYPRPCCQRRGGLSVCLSIPLSTSDTIYLQTDGSDDEIGHAEESRGGGVESERQERAEERAD